MYTRRHYIVRVVVCQNSRLLHELQHLTSKVYMLSCMVIPCTRLVVWSCLDEV